MIKLIKNVFLMMLLCCFIQCTALQQTINTLPSSGNTTQDEIVEGLKQALTIGTQNSTARLSAVDGFFANAAVKILLPPDAAKAESTLRQFGLGSLVDKAVLSLNRAAEDASKSATPIFINAIKQMTITDAIGILKGGDFAATNYFRQKTTDTLTSTFKPIISASLNKVDATKYWSDVFTTYNRLSLGNNVNPDLNAYVTQKAIDGIFYEVGLEEQKIRKDPAARITDLLKKVFSQQ